MSCKTDKKFKKPTRRNKALMLMAVYFGLTAFAGAFTVNAATSVAEQSGITASANSSQVVLGGVRNFALSSVREISVNQSINSVNVTVHSGSNIIVSFDAPDNNHIRAAYTLDDGRLTIVDYWRDAASTRSRLHSGTLNISIPHTASSDLNFLNINVASARIDINGQSSFLADDVVLRTANGRISITDLNASNITAATANGAITAKDLVVDEDVVMSTANGNVAVYDSVISGHLSIRLVRGNITLNNVDADTNTLRTIVGRVRTN